MSQFLTHHSSGTHAGRRFLLRARGHEALRDAGADRAAERLASRLRHGIDQGHALLQWRHAQEELGQGLEWPPDASASDRLPPGLESRNTLLLVRLQLFASDLDSGMGKKHAHATVQVAMDEEQAHERERVLRSNRALPSRGARIRFPCGPLYHVHVHVHVST